MNKKRLGFISLGLIILVFLIALTIFQNNLAIDRCDRQRHEIEAQLEAEFGSRQQALESQKKQNQSKFVAEFNARAKQEPQIPIMNDRIINEVLLHDEFQQLELDRQSWLIQNIRPFCNLLGGSHERSH